ncbi:dipeptidase PepV [Fusibacter sp. 3D3]|uniref:dipeptidase PepV n=1 Tax=Fusibacter sp. 3D3 TaxID=1048380 RepID=UPI0008529863|nr:dipeptidase PepV [Fusibacter sp. 3D3]GAU76365.1 acetylornithine deacetylase/succinyl-diaminopimelate desuccinylase [Fusibacter sp. 3D3]
MTFEKTVQIFKDDIIKSTQELVQIKSVKTPAVGDMPFGKGIQDALEYTLSLGKSLGFKTKNVDNHAGYIEFGEGKEMVGILCHLDVVPEGDHWTYAPFSATIADDKIYGRGAIDDKGPVIASLYAMKSLKDIGIVPKKRIRLILGTDEESGGKCMAYYLKHEEVPTVSFSPDADFPVIHGEMGIVVFKLEKTFTDKCDDGGIKVLSVKGGNAPNMVPDYAEVRLIENHPIEAILKAFNATNGTQIEYIKEDTFTTLKSHGVSAHGSTPEKGKNAISALIQFLDLVDLEIGDQSNFIRFLSRTIGSETNGESFGIGLKDEYNELVFNLGLIDIDENQGSITVNARYPITIKEKLVRAGVEGTLQNTGIEITKWAGKEPLFFKPNHPLVKTLMKVYREHTGDLDSKPITIGGGTYARSMPNSVAFGALFPGKADTMHQRDEHIEIRDLLKITEIYASALYELLNL